MYGNTSYSVQKKRRNIWGMKTLKMCLGKDRLKQHESIIEPGNNFYLIFLTFKYLKNCNQIVKYSLDMFILYDDQV